MIKNVEASFGTKVVGDVYLDKRLVTPRYIYDFVSFNSALGFKMSKCICSSEQDCMIMDIKLRKYLQVNDAVNIGDKIFVGGTLEESTHLIRYNSRLDREITITVGLPVIDQMAVWGSDELVVSGPGVCLIFDTDLQLLRILKTKVFDKPGSRVAILKTLIPAPDVLVSSITVTHKKDYRTAVVVSRDGEIDTTIDGQFLIKAEMKEDALILFCAESMVKRMNVYAIKDSSIKYVRVQGDVLDGDMRFNDTGLVWYEFENTMVNPLKVTIMEKNYARTESSKAGKESIERG